MLYENFEDFFLYSNSDRVTARNSFEKECELVRKNNTSSLDELHQETIDINEQYIIANQIVSTTQLVC